MLLAAVIRYNLYITSVSIHGAWLYVCYSVSWFFWWSLLHQSLVVPILNVDTLSAKHMHVSQVKTLLIVIRMANVHIKIAVLEYIFVQIVPSAQHLQGIIALQEV